MYGHRTGPSVRIELYKETVLARNCAILQLNVDIWFGKLLSKLKLHQLCSVPLTGQKKICNIFNK